MPQSLFGHLAHNFSAHPENLATEALSFVLNRSPVAVEAFGRLLSQTGALVPHGLHYQAQVAGDDQAIPDLVGISASNAQPVICEAKFWAGLTDNQPITYLKRLPMPEGGLVIFLAPAKRLPSLWAELLRRCAQEGLTPTPLESRPDEMLTAQLAAGQFIAAVSWRLTLNAVKYALETEGDLETAADVRQLEGLCETMDSEAFLPIQSEELSPTIGARLLRYNELVDDLTNELVAAGVASTTGLRATPTYSGYGRYMTIGGHGVMLQVNAQYWATLRDTPIWLSLKAISGSHWSYSPLTRERLVKLEHELPTRLLRDGDSLVVPLFLTVGVERSGAMNALRKQMREVIGLVEPSVTGIWGTTA